MMNDLGDLKHAYEIALKNHLALSEDAWLTQFRQKQFDLFLTRGFPSTRDERWKYTNLSLLGHQSFRSASRFKSLVSKEQIEKLSLTDACRLVFVNGCFQPHLSEKDCANILVTSLSEALVTEKDFLQPYLEGYKTLSAWSHLNTACMQDGYVIRIPKHHSVDRPIHLLFLTSHEVADNLQNIRNLVVVEENARAIFIEEHQSLSQDTYFTNVVTQIHAKEAATVDFIRLQNQNVQAFNIAHTQISQNKNSEVTIHDYNLGSRLAREEIQCFLNEKEASAKLNGLYLPLYQQHIDTQLSVYHLADHTSSDEWFKGVAAHQSRGVFNGKIEVGKTIKQAKANLQNKNLLLTPDAQINTKPELEIYSDDVKCQHGATIGQIDSDMLFYLRSRGIAQRDAYQLLLLAFVNEHLNKLPQSSIADKIKNFVLKHCEEVFK